MAPVKPPLPPAVAPVPVVPPDDIPVETVASAVENPVEAQAEVINNQKQRQFDKASAIAASVKKNQEYQQLEAQMRVRLELMLET